jgi:hypothetical protein
MLCIVLMCQLHCVLFLFDYFIVVRLFIRFCSSFFWLVFRFFCFSLFIVWKKNIQFWSWIVFQVFRSCYAIVEEVPSSSMQVNKHHTSDCTIFVLVEERVAYYDHRHRHSITNILQVVKQVEGKTLSDNDKKRWWFPIGPEGWLEEATTFL